jgi:hypothetical protein
VYNTANNKLVQYAGDQKYDFEYNFSTGGLNAKWKLWPVSIGLSTVANRQGISPPSYTVSAERKLSF